MSLDSIIHFIFGISISPDQAKVMDGRRRFREAIHLNRNEATRAIATARLAHKVSDEAYEALNRTIEVQEKTVEARLIRRLKELD